MTQRALACLLVALLLGAGSPAVGKDKEEGPVTLKCGDMTVVLAPEWAWNIKQLQYKDFSLLTDKVQMYSGAAVNIAGDEWAGSGFGDDKVGPQTLKIDRKRTPFKPGQTHTAKEEIIYGKRSKFGPYKLEMEIKIRSDEIEQTHEFKRSKSGRIEKLYAFMYPFSNEFNLFSAQAWGDPNDPNTKRFTGAFYGEDADLLKYNVKWFGIFCNERRTGVVCIYGAKHNIEEEGTVLLDKAEVREYHFRPKVMHEGRGEKLEFRLRMKLLKTKSVGAFTQAAAKLAGGHWDPQIE